MEYNCGALREEGVDEEASLYGWCRYKRDHGGKIFIDLADRYGTTQLVFEGEMTNKAGEIGKEYVINARGKVRLRDKDTIDTTNPTGRIEVYVTSFKIISRSEVPPFEIIEEKKKFLANEELRMRYRYLDLRRREMIDKIEFRDRATKTVRRFFWENGFLELETPTLVKDTYETGSRTFLVPSRTNKGKFYSLPQSPQVYKQLCMMAGLDKYFQMARCFRDEDPREDRQPEHTQIDVEISFKDEEYIQDLIEMLLKQLFKEMLGKRIKIPFRHMAYEDAISNYGSDRPDLRFESKIVDITEEARRSNYNILKRVAERKGRAKAVAFDADFGAKAHRLDKPYMLTMIELAKTLGLGGLTWLYVKDGRIRSEPESIAESLVDAANAIISKLEAKEGNVIIIGADPSERLLLDVLGKLRKIIGNKVGRYRSEYEFLWIDRFPLFEKDEVTNKLKPSHNPFTAPTDSSIKLLDKEPEKTMSRQYDVVLNGVEIGGGSIRINDPDLQVKVLKLIGMSEESIEGTFGFLIDALRHGAPVEGGIALGYDRLIAAMYGIEDIRDFILFPKNKKYESPIDGSPTPINSKRLRDDFNIVISDM